MRENLATVAISVKTTLAKQDLWSLEAGCPFAKMISPKILFCPP
jgi:hypothetical protein